MGAVAARIALESQQLKLEPSSNVWAAFYGVWQHGQEEDIARPRCGPSLALRNSAEPVFWPAQAPASLAPQPVEPLTSRCARNERRELKVSTLSAMKGWQRIERSNTMLQRVQSPVRSSKKA